MSLRLNIPLLPVVSLKNTKIEDEFSCWKPFGVALSKKSADLLKTHFGFDQVDIARPKLGREELSALSELIATSAKFLSYEDISFFQSKQLQEICSDSSHIDRFLESIVNRSTVIFFSIFPRINNMLQINKGTTEEQAKLIRNVAQNVFDEITKIEQQEPLIGLRIIPKEIIRLVNLATIRLRIPDVTHFPNYKYCFNLQSLSISSRSMVSISNVINCCTSLINLHLECDNISMIPNLGQLSSLETCELNTPFLGLLPELPIVSLKILSITRNQEIFIPPELTKKVEKGALKLNLTCLRPMRLQLSPLKRHFSCPESGSRSSSDSAG